MSATVSVSLPALEGGAGADALHAAGVPAARPLGVLVRRAARAVLEAEGAAELELSITLLDDDAIRTLNRDWLGRDKPTDVIAFALGEGDAAPMGDVYIGVERAVEQAREAGVAVREELVRLVVHGTLHVLGYDHDEGAGRTQGEMWRRQEALVQRIVGDA